MYFLLGVALIVLGIDFSSGVSRWKSNQVVTQGTFISEYYIK